jgi:hypothetical protein
VQHKRRFKGFSAVWIIKGMHGKLAIFKPLKLKLQLCQHDAVQLRLLACCSSR